MRQLIMKSLALWLLLLHAAGAQTIGLDMPDVRREYALRMAAWKVGYRVELHQPVPGRVEVFMRHVSLPAAMAKLLSGRASYRILPGRLVVVGSGPLVPLEQAHYRLENVRAETVMARLEPDYPWVRFERMSVENGFIARGPAGDCQEIRDRLPLLDRTANLDLKNVRRAYALRMAAWQCGYKVLGWYGSGDKMDARLVNASIEQAVEQLVEGRTQAQILPAERLVVLGNASERARKLDFERHRQIVALDRQEIILENRDVSEVLERLKGEYPWVSFYPHPTMNGFYLSGPKNDVLEIARRARELDLGR